MDGKDKKQNVKKGVFMLLFFINTLSFTNILLTATLIKVQTKYFIHANDIKGFLFMKYPA